MHGQHRYFVGLDFGQTQEFTALAVLEHSRPAWVRNSPRPPRQYRVGLLERFPLGTPYKEIVARVRELVAICPKGEVIPLFRHAKIAVDQTGVGRAVVALLKEAGLQNDIRPILITSGHTTSFEDGVQCVPKKELVSTLQVLLQGRRLTIAAVPERETLFKEFLTFKVKVSVAGTDPFESWRERDHDDLVLAIAIAAWLGEREPDYSGCLPIAGRRRAW